MSKAVFVEGAGVEVRVEVIEVGAVLGMSTVVLADEIDARDVSLGNYIKRGRLTGRPLYAIAVFRVRPFLFLLVVDLPNLE